MPAAAPPYNPRRTIVPLGSNYPYDLHPDGKRLAVGAAQDEDFAAQDRVVFVSNVFDHLRNFVRCYSTHCGITGDRTYSALEWAPF